MQHEEQTANCPMASSLLSCLWCRLDHVYRGKGSEQPSAPMFTVNFQLQQPVGQDPTNLQLQMSPEAMKVCVVVACGRCGE